MTDNQLLSLVLGILDPKAQFRDGLSRGDRLLLALPRQREAFQRTLGLYQPQRPAARVMVSVLHLLSRAGFHRLLLARQTISARTVTVTPQVDGVEPGSCGVLLGSPEHRNRRAVASYRRNGAWEVAKISPCGEGADALEQEALILTELGSRTPGVPAVLGFHRGKEAAMLRMPYLTGTPIAQDDTAAALDLLQSWIPDSELAPATDFPEWQAIETALGGLIGGPEILRRLAEVQLRPVIRHGDFTRWNLLRQNDGSLAVLDWEWGDRHGMPGLDLVHYFLQDCRLVRRLPPENAIQETLEKLMFPACREILARSGWRGDPLLPIIASLAWKQGAGHQENDKVLEAAVRNVE